MENTKICSKCGRELPLEFFCKDKSKKDGLQAYCKECKKQHNNQYFKQWYATIEGYARRIRNDNLKADRKYGRIGAEEDPLPMIEEYIHLLSQPDFYDKKQYHWSEMGLDRIDNTKPHTLDNVVPCSTVHNIQRGKMNFEEFCAVMNKKE